MEEQENDLYFCETEEKEVEIFQRFVTPHYQPSPTPVAMAVGAIMPTERSVIKVYHKRQFGIPLANTRVASTNIDSMPPSMTLSPRFQYDYSLFGMQGNAKMNFCYAKTLAEFDRCNDKFDLIYIRNPDLYAAGEWEDIFTKALEWTNPRGGVTITLIREEDRRKFKGLLEKLKDQFNIEPVFAGETNMSINPNPNSSVENFQHTMGVFKPKA